MEEIEAIITGRVQLVLFRDFARRKALKLGLIGFVRNNPDGTVIVVAQGERSKLGEFTEHLRKGSLLSRVDSVSVVSRFPKKPYIDFTISY
jgi:acylphosphatase